ncbi:50S ribosomal protein L9 [Aquimarina rhabdastrellae]
MEVILKRDVENLGFADDVVEVKNGYGRNYLIPQGFAVLATPSAKKVLAENLKQRAFKEKKEIEDAQALASKLASLEIKIAAKAGAGDKLFGSVSNIDLAEALGKEGIQIEKKFINVPGGTIKRLGQYEAAVRFHREVIATASFDVVAQKEA